MRAWVRPLANVEAAIMHTLNLSWMQRPHRLMLRSERANSPLKCVCLCREGLTIQMNICVRVPMHFRPWMCQYRSLYVHLYMRVFMCNASD